MKNPPADSSTGEFLDYAEPTWELLTRADVESRLGYPVTELPRESAWGELDVAKVDEWVCIPAMIQYTIWSDVYRCEGFVTVQEPTGKISTRGKNAGKPMVQKKRSARGCGHEIVLWNVAVDDPTGSVRDDFLCPSCSQQWTKYDLDFVKAVPVHVAIDFTRLSGTDGRYYRKVSRRDLDNVARIEGETIRDWFPDDVIYPHRELMSMGVTKHGVSRISDFYTPRNLRALARLWAEASRVKLNTSMLFLITSTFSHIERTTRYKFRRGGNSSLAGLLYIGSITVEDNIQRQLDTKIRQVCAGLTQLAKNRGASHVSSIVNNGSAECLKWLPDESLDYIFTDPPFGGNIFYSDASMLYEAWLGNVTDQERELVFHRRSKQQREKDGYVFKTLTDYATGMAKAFREMFRVLKPGRWATVEFNNSDGTVFEAIKNAVRSAGFEIANMLLLDKAQKTFKQLQGAEGTQDVVDKDVLFNLHKPAVIKAESKQIDHDLEHQVTDAVRSHLLSLPARIQSEPAKYSDEHRTTATINSMLMNSLIPRGVSVEQLTLPFIERVCSRYFRKIGQHWYLRGEAVGGNGNGGLFEEEVAVKDDLSAIDWVRQKIRERPLLIGEIKPLWMCATGLLPADVSQTLILEDLLKENFWQDEDTNRWREPTGAERERMNDDRSTRVVHDAERYLVGSLRRQTTDAERCEWIDILFKACRQVEEGDIQSAPTLRDFDTGEGYRRITRLFQSVLRDHVVAGVYAKASKQASAASNRVSEGVRRDEEELAAERKKTQPSLFD